MYEFKALYDDSPLAILRADAAGSASYANRACSAMTGWPADQLLGEGWLDAIDPPDREQVLQMWRAACRADWPLDAAFRLLRPDGSRRFVRLSSRPVRGQAGAKEYVAVLNDVTEQTLAERRLRRHEELLGAILGNIPCGISIYDAEGRLILDNDEAGRAWRVADLAPADPGTGFASTAAGLTAGGSADVGPGDTGPAYRAIRPRPSSREEVQPDGRVLQIRDATLADGGLVTTYTDVTRQKQYIETLEQAKAAAEQAAAAKAAFLATMSHEIRTPMNGVIGMTNILLESSLSADQLELVEVIRQSGESLLVLINEILDYSKIESGQMELEWLPLRIREVVDNCLLLLSRQAHEKGVTLSVEGDPAVPRLVLGDRTRLQQVLVNLISNAVKFTDNGEVRVGLRIASDPPAGRAACTGDLCEVEICVEDTGIGIPQDKLEVIFEPFVQADSSTARRFGGTGLGLAIAKRLVRAMGGSISVQSEPGRGTKMCFTFIAEVAVPGASPTGDRQGSLWRKRVLLVAGKQADVGVLRTQLRRWGMDVEPCAGLAQAEARLRSQDSADLVLVATHMSDARWFEFVRSLRDQGIGVPAVLLSRTRKTQAVDEALGAHILARASTEASLYDALADALHPAGDAGTGPQTNPQFDDSLGQASPLAILVAEDNEINRRVALRMLARFGYEADVARNGAEVIEAVRKKKYDLVLMDIQMPEVDGLEATRFIVKNFPPGQRPRVVAMSANVMREDVATAMAAGANAYIAKPFAPSELRSALRESAQRSAAPQAQADGSAPPLLALDRLRWYLEADPEGGFLQGLCRDFSRACEELELRLRSSIQAENWADVRAVAHEYAGVCAVVGADRLSELLMRVQQMARAGGQGEIEQMLPECVQVRKQTASALASAMLLHGLPRSADLEGPGHLRDEEA